MATPVELLAALEDLADGEFKKFKWYLQQAEVLEGFPAIPKSQLENADRLDTVDEITDTYNKNAVEVTIKVLKMIKKNDLVERLSNINSTTKGEYRKISKHMKVRFILASSSVCSPIIFILPGLFHEYLNLQVIGNTTLNEY